MFSDEPDPTLFTTLRQRHLRQNARRTAEKAKEATKKEARSRGGEVHPMYSIHGTEVSCEQFQFVRLHLQ